MKPRAVVVCVEYHDTLAVTLPTAQAAFASVLVVSSPADTKTAAVAATAGADLLTTDLFWWGGAAFNKGVALDEGLKRLGRDGWMAVIDADVVFPPDVDWSTLRPGCLNVPRRRQFGSIAGWGPRVNPLALPVVDEGTEFPGYCQVWQADDPATVAPPLYPRRWRHAGGCDSEFMWRWPAEKRIRLPWDVVHLGPLNRNWHGRVTPFADGTVPATAKERGADHQRDRSQRLDTRDYRHEWLDPAP